MRKRHVLLLHTLQPLDAPQLSTGPALLEPGLTIDQLLHSDPNADFDNETNLGTGLINLYDWIEKRQTRLISKARSKRLSLADPGSFCHFCCGLVNIKSDYKTTVRNVGYRNFSDLDIKPLNKKHIAINQSRQEIVILVNPYAVFEAYIAAGKETNFKRFSNPNTIAEIERDIMDCKTYGIQEMRAELGAYPNNPFAVQESIMGLIMRLRGESYVNKYKEIYNRPIPRADNPFGL